ncbi:MAG TPA: hypothetical protein VFF17_07080 [Thermoanaerobaculia bacterium]|nr:hypothetical protein [Thermoanaerobaculia bacterium]
MSSDCRRLDAALESADGAALAAARAHAASCARCGERLKAFDEISAAAPGLRKGWDSPELWPRIRESLAREAFAPAAAAPAPRKTSRWPAWLPIAAIATLFLLSFVGLQVFRPSLGDRQIFGVRPLPRDPLLTDVALDDVERSESEYVRSIENLSKLAQPRLDAPEATPLLLSYREKLFLLDNAIAELNGEIRMNRYNTHLRRQLLGMYAEKQRTLRDVMKGASS